jgi:hypothetical protein
VADFAASLEKRHPDRLAALLSKKPQMNANERE